MSQSARKREQGLFLTQEDIDTALRGVDTSAAVIDADDLEALLLDEAYIIDSDLEDSEYFGLLSQEDIEALLHGDLTGSRGSDGSQEEIDSLLTTAASEKSDVPPTPGGRSGDRNVVQDDVEELIQKTIAGVGEEEVPVVSETTAEETEMREGAGAVSQDDIDRLLMSAIDEGDEDRGNDFEDETPPPNEQSAISQSDIDRLLKGGLEQAEIEMDFGEPSAETQEIQESRDDMGDLLSQSDLDQLVGEKIPQGKKEETLTRDEDTSSEHISQSDINRLLKESLEEEDMPGEEEEEEDSETFDEADATEPVILAADEEVAEEPVPSKPDPAPAPKPRKKVRNVFRKKRLLTGLAACMVLVLAASMFSIFSGEEEVLKPRVLTFAVPQSDTGGNSMQPVSERSVYLTGFIVLAPPNPAEITYVSGDLLLKLSDASLVDLIKENEAYVRDIVYGTISSELMTRDISTIDEISLELAIRKGLGRIIPREAIERIDLEKFAMA